MLRLRSESLGTVLFTALGLLPLACGGKSAGIFEEDTESGGRGSGGSVGTGAGGVATSGGVAASGGTGAVVGSGAAPGSGGTLANGGSGAAPGTGGATTVNEFPCENPTPLGGGYESCADGTVHRSRVQACPLKIPREEEIIPPPNLVDIDCTKDSDCSAQPYGYCAAYPSGFAPTQSCNYGCKVDADCGEGRICECGELAGTCVPSTCASDEACGKGYRCQSYDAQPSCGARSFACQTPKDGCGGKCSDGKACVAGESGFQCVQAGCVIGRPFLVEGEQRTASAASSTAWLGARFSATPCELPLGARKRIAEVWTQVGLMEHASVAAFARFALQLLSLGAPPELLERTTRAMADETRHAQLAFSVASHYAGFAVGPGALDIAHALTETTLVEVTRLAVREGCFGETTAALEALELAAHASSPALAEILSGIARDETEHAELAFRFVRWALERGGERVARCIRAELERFEATAAETLRPSEWSAEELCHGVASEQLRGQIRLQAGWTVTRPALLALLASQIRSSEIPLVSA